MSVPLFSVVVSVAGDAGPLTACLAAIDTAAARVDDRIEIVVATHDASLHLGSAAATMRWTSPNATGRRQTTGALRNLGAAESTGLMLVFVDVASELHRDTFRAVKRRLISGRHVGGTTTVQHRHAMHGSRRDQAHEHGVGHGLGHGVSATVAHITTRLLQPAGAAMWCWHRDFDLIGGYDVRMAPGESADLARRMRRHGQHTHRTFVVLDEIPVVATARGLLHGASRSLVDASSLHVAS